MSEPDPLNCNTTCWKKALHVQPNECDEIRSTFSFSCVMGHSPFIILINFFSFFFFFFFYKRNWPKLFFTCRCLSACVYVSRTCSQPPLYLMSASCWFLSLTSAQSDFQSSIKYHLERCASLFFFFPAHFLPSLSWMAREARGSGEEEEEGKKMERSWVMDALCVSVIPNYWTLPFKAPLRCISHFCLSDWWRAGSDWVPCVLKHCLGSHSLFTSYCCSTQLFLIYIQLHVAIFKCALPTRLGLLWRNAVTD